ncbi:hypothetical protein [Rhodopirellula bahusiensis]|uniref:hypothetical protein n=1 Tax=Rhodopirellula bahusiensis TaxID=2014065 RepID=UPI003265E861
MSSWQFDGMLPDYLLIHAIEAGCLVDFADAIAHGAQITAKDVAGRSVLEVAMNFGQLDIAREQIRLGSDTKGTIGKQNDRLIHRSTRIGNIGFLTVLLQTGVHSDSIDTRRKPSCPMGLRSHVAN